MITFSSTLVLLAAIVFATRRLLRYLHIFQQDEYDARRFVNWLFSEAAFDKRLSAALLLLIIAARNMNIGWVTLNIAIGLAFLAFAAVETDPRSDAKKKLVLTERATRILGTAFLLSVIFACLALQFGGNWYWLALVQSLPFILVLSNWMLSPYEKRIQNGFRERAEARLREVNPTVIGITGSFGKTSVKHILGHVLQLNTSALFTPGSVNTVMGITRIINERLDEGCKYFIVEMGAYGKGSIERLCNFTPPHHGILTSIGAAHYERFKDLETVAEAKFELATAVKQRSGKMVIDEHILERDHARQRVDADRANFIIVGESETADVRIISIEQTAKGLDVTLEHNGETVSLFAPLFGIHHGRNMALSFALAHTIGIEASRIVTALRSTPQIQHRLEVKHQPSGVIYLDDAYNANPAGFANALDLMQVLRKGDARRILITPGVAELGLKHDAAHLELGRKAAETTDIVVVVKPERIPTFIEGLHSSQHPPKIFTFEQFTEARVWLDANAKSGDVVLVENDLPDLYERTFPT
ncbi:MAG: UDP-N-acetylmuramoyl-tripeptide--D-alanyl-D-alanine ligase [Hyphomicrobiaceae bacterium]